MKILDQLDSTLMKVFTFNSRFEKPEDRPQLVSAIISTCVFLFLIFAWDNSIISTIFVILLFISSYYEWRLWFRLKKEPINKHFQKGN